MGGSQSTQYNTSKTNQNSKKKKVSIGDILEFPSPKKPYSHYGIYIADYGGKSNLVVHFTAPDAEAANAVLSQVGHCSVATCYASLTSPLTLVPGITEDVLTDASKFATTVRDVSRGTKNTLVQMTEIKDLLDFYPCALINNHNDSRWKPREQHEIRERAISHYTTGFNKKKYNLFLSNCEHFVNDIRYGKHRSLQVEEFGFVIFGAGVVLAGAVLDEIVQGLPFPPEKPKFRLLREFIDDGAVEKKL